MALVTLVTWRPGYGQEEQWLLPLTTVLGSDELPYTQLEPLGGCQNIRPCGSGKEQLLPTLSSCLNGGLPVARGDRR